MTSIAAVQTSHTVSSAALAVSPSSTASDLYYERIAEMSLTMTTVSCDFCAADLMVSSTVRDLRCCHCGNYTCTPRQIKRLNQMSFGQMAATHER